MKQYIKHPSVKSITVYRENDGAGSYALQADNYDTIMVTLGMSSLSDYVRVAKSYPQVGGWVSLSDNKEELKLLKVLTINFK